MFTNFSDPIGSFELIIRFRARLGPDAIDVGSGTILAQSFFGPQWCQRRQASTNNGYCIFGEKPEKRASSEVLVHRQSATQALNVGHERGLTWSIFVKCLWVVISECHNLHKGGDTSNPRGENPVAISMRILDIDAGSTDTEPSMRISITLIFVLHGSWSEAITGSGSASTKISRTKSDHANPWYIFCTSKQLLG